jgi:DNA repair exonuclease SbcCD ATPase subunit
VEAGARRPLGPEGQPLTPEEEAELARVEARNSRRWAYAALFLALLATLGAAIALIFLVSEATNEQTAASEESVMELRDDVRRVEERSQAARRARSEAETAEGRSRSLREQVEDLETRVEETNDRAESTQQALTSLSSELQDDIQQLRDRVDRLNR